MKIIVVGIFWLGFFHISLSAQVSPIPVVDSEIRDSTSIRMRSLEIERAERNANKPPPTEISIEAKNRLARISDDFESIQRLQLLIVEAYTTGRAINYRRISESAAEMKKRAVRLGTDFFNTNEETRLDDDRRKRSIAGETVRDLVIELDNAVYKFVSSPIFNKAVVDSRLVEKTQVYLLNIIVLSHRLSHLAQNPK